MKRIHHLITGAGLLCLAICFNCKTAYAQSNPTVLPKFNIFDSYELAIETEKLNEYDFKFTMTYAGHDDKDQVFALMPLTMDAFVNAFTSSFEKLVEGDSGRFVKAPLTLNGEAIRVFYIVQSMGITSQLMNVSPDAGRISFEKEIQIRKYQKINTKELSEVLKYYSVHKDSREEGHRSFGVYRIHDSDPILIEQFRYKKEAKNAKHYLAELEISNKYQNSLDIDRIELSIWENSLTKLIAERNEINKLLSEINPDIDRVKRIKVEVDSLQKVILESWPAISIAAKDFDYTAQRLNGKNASAKDFNLLFDYHYPWETESRTINASEIINKKNGLLFDLEREGVDLDSYLRIIQSLIKLKKDNIKLTKKSFSPDEAEIFARYSAILSRNVDTLTKVNLSRLELFEANAKRAIEENKVKRLKADNFIVMVEAYLKSFLKLESEMLFIETLEHPIKAKHENLNSRLDENSNAIDKAEARISSLNLSIELLSDDLPIQPFVVEYVSIEFNEGFIENIMVFGHLKYKPEEKVKFENVIPIGFSRKKDFSALRNFELWTEPVANGNSAQYRMNLEDLITNYEENFALNRRDYSPADGVQKFDLAAQNSWVLKKAPAYQLFEARVFSDFVGLDSKSPNGLIQTEIGQKISLINVRVGIRYHSFGGIISPRNLKHHGFSYVNYGSLGYIRPSLTLSKIENNNRSLYLNSRDLIVNNQYFQERFASTLQLRNYEYFNVGFDLNLFTFDIPNLKSTFYADWGFRYGRTQVIDSVRSISDSIPQNTGKGSEFGVNTYRYFGKLTWEIKPDERFGLSTSWYWNSYHLWNPDIRQVAVSSQYAFDGTNERPFKYATIELQAFFNPSVDNPTGKLFFRYTFNHMKEGRWNTNFHQAQVGYSFYLMGRNKNR